MFLLVAAIICSVTVSVFLKLARRYPLDLAQSILSNYFIASALTWFLFKPDLQLLATPSIHWQLLHLLGVLLPGVYLIMVTAVAKNGIAISDAAQRLSLFIPLLAAFILFGETAQSLTIVGIAMAFLALFLLLARPKLTGVKPTTANRWLLLGVWLGYGVIDICFKQMAKTGTDFSVSLLASFILAAVLLASWLIWQKSKWHIPSLSAGIALGLLNFGNIYAYISAHQSMPDNPALVFTAMNIGVISLGALTGEYIFKERLSKLNIAGLICALIAILLLLP